MSKTRQQIQFKVLAMLLGGDVGVSPSAEDATTIDGYIDDVVAELSAELVVDIVDPNELDDVLFSPFCKLVADAAAEEFGGVSNEQNAKQWRNRIKVLTSQIPGYGPQEATFY